MNLFELNEKELEVLKVTEEQKVIEIKEVISNREEDLKFTHILQRAEDINSKCADFNVSEADTHNINLKWNKSTPSVIYTPDNSIVNRNAGISKYALGQLCGKIGVPAQYIMKCADNDLTDLATKNVNTWLDMYGKNLFVREYDGQVRGILSQKYAVCDSHEIINVVRDVAGFDQYKLKGSLLNEERLHLRMIDRKPLEIADGDKENPGLQDLFTGITIDSSDVGRSVLTVNFFIYKQVCTNGMVVSKLSGTLFKQKHIGITAAEFKEGLVAGLKVLPDLRREAVTLIKNNMEEGSPYSKAHYSEEEMAKVVADIRQKTLLSEEAAKKVINLMNERYNRSKWGYYNAITEVAQDFTFEKRLDLERLAGNLLFA